MSRYRTHTCGQLRADQVGTEVKLSGWVHRKRDHGNLLFIDLRDHYGVTQCVAESGSAPFKQMEGLRSEYVVSVSGKVVARTPETANPNLPTGMIELRVSSSRFSPRRRNCRCRFSAIRNIRKTSASNTASSICGAIACTRTSCCAAR
jgi:aspartyl-tRNA synthetase